MPQPHHPVGPEARDLTPEEWAERKALCHSLDGRIKESLLVGRVAAWRLAEDVYRFDAENGWSALEDENGNRFESLAEWLRQPNVDLNEREYHRLVARWEQLVVRRKVDRETLKQLPPTKVDVVLPALKDGRVLLDQALEDVRSKPQKVLKVEYCEPRGPVNRTSQPDQSTTAVDRSSQPDQSTTPKPDRDATPEQPVVASDIDQPAPSSAIGEPEPEPDNDEPVLTLDQAIDQARGIGPLDASAIRHRTDALICAHERDQALQQIFAAADREQVAAA